MKYVNTHGYDMSVFSLGTVQLGIDYGFGEFRTKPTKERSDAILNKAYELGVNTLDTANNYGESDKIIGNWMKESGKKPIIVTKIGPFDHSSPEALRADILSQGRKCLEAMQVDQIDIIMDHNFEDFEKNPEIVKECFDQLKAEGVMKLSGISAYSVNDYEAIANSGFDVVQIPQNIFDWTQIDNGGIQKMADAGMAIFARSVFLQGLVFMKPDELDEDMKFCAPWIQKFRDLADEFGLEPPVLALSFVLSLPAITTVVLGCQTPEQIESNCEMMDKVIKLTDAQMEKIHEAFKDIPVKVINPTLWHK